MSVNFLTHLVRVKNTNNIFIFLVFSLLILNSCERPSPCSDCNVGRSASWSRDLRLPTGLDLSHGEIITLDYDNRKVLIIDEKSGKVKDYLPINYDTVKSGEIVPWVMSPKFIVYERTFNYQKSYLQIYDRKLKTVTDSILIQLQGDISGGKGIVKVFDRPVIDNFNLLFITNDGFLSSYNIEKKRLIWRVKLGALPIAGILKTKDKIHIQISDYLGSKSRIVTLSDKTGNKIWTKLFPGKMPLNLFKYNLIDVASNGDIIKINPENGHFSDSGSINTSPIQFDIADRYLIVGNENNELFIKDLKGQKPDRKFKICARPIEFSFSRQKDNLYFVDEMQHFLQIKLDVNQIKCVHQFVDNTDCYHNFIIHGDSLFLNKSGKLSLFKLR